MDELDELEAHEQKERGEEETRQESQLLVLSSEVLAPASTP
jgi:hypothetical protein